MPVPCVAAASVAAVVGATHDCIGDMESVHEDASSPQRVNFDESVVNKEEDILQVHPVVFEGSERSVGKQPLSTYRRSNSGTIQIGHVANGEGDYRNVRGFVNGHFSSGIINQLRFSGSSCRVTEYIPCTGEILAVGLVDQVVFYETSGYQEAHRVEVNGTVSAMKWAVSKGSLSYITVATRSGSVYVFKVRPELLEIEGCVEVYRCQLKYEVHAVDTEFIGRLEPTLFVVLGDDSGMLTSICLDHNDSLLSKHSISGVSKSPILGAAISIEHQYLALCTDGGEVIVLGYKRDGTKTVVIETHLREEKMVPLERWHCRKNGAIRCIAFGNGFMAFGGYEKRVEIVDTKRWSPMRVLHVGGTVSSIVLDRSDQYLAVGARDKSLTLFDTSTLMPVKTLETSGWVTSVSFGNKGVIAVRSEKNCVSIMDLSPICRTSIRLSSDLGGIYAVSWNADGSLLARIVRNIVAIAEADDEFTEVAAHAFRHDVTGVAFRATKQDLDDHLAVVDAGGNMTLLALSRHGNDFFLTVLRTMHVDECPLSVVAWSCDGNLVAAGGKGQRLHIFKSEKLKRWAEPVDVDSRIWSIDFAPSGCRSCMMAVAFGDYSAVLFDHEMDAKLRIVRPRVVRCLKFHPFKNHLAVGDASGTIALVDFENEDIFLEINVGDRVNSIDFSPSGDYIVYGTDAGVVRLLETESFQCLQEIYGSGFALCSRFSPSGLYLGMGFSNESYSMLRMGPFLGTDIFPMHIDERVSKMPVWALNEVMYRSVDGPSLVQRHMMEGGPANLRRLKTIVKEHPNAIFAFDRLSGKGFFDTALALGKPKMLQLALTALVDGTIESNSSGTRSVLDTETTLRGREALTFVLERFPADVTVAVFDAIAFARVPFTEPRVVDKRQSRECGSASFASPWDKEPVTTVERQPCSLNLLDEEAKKGLPLTPAVLPLPGLGEMDMLSCLLRHAPAEVFDNDAMTLVLNVLWTDHIRKYFIMDSLLFALFYTLWVALVDKTSADALSRANQTSETTIALLVAAMNTVYFVKELVQSRFGRRRGYFRLVWNWIDIFTAAFVYVYVSMVLVFNRGDSSLQTVAVFTTILLTAKLLSYLRGFGDTGWLISVLIANFTDVGGFLIVLTTILAGFAVSFRILFGPSGDETFSSLRRSFLSTFELTIMGSYEPDLLYQNSNTVLAAFTFVLAVTCVLVVALNALISILADSYARVQENATANRRREQAQLIVEYMSLLPPRFRRRVETETKWFHSLLEVDADGDLLVQSEDWEGGLNTMRKHVEDTANENMVATQKLIDQMKADIDAELATLRKEMLSSLENVAEDVRKIRRAQTQGGVTFSGKNVAKAVNAVKSIGRKGERFFGR